MPVTLSIFFWWRIPWTCSTTRHYIDPFYVHIRHGQAKPKRWWVIRSFEFSWAGFRQTIYPNMLTNQTHKAIEWLVDIDDMRKKGTWYPRGKRQLARNLTSSCQSSWFPLRISSQPTPTIPDLFGLLTWSILHNGEHYLSQLDPREITISKSGHILLTQAPAM